MVSDTSCSIRREPRLLPSWTLLIQRETENDSEWKWKKIMRERNNDRSPNSRCAFKRAVNCLYVLLGRIPRLWLHNQFFSGNTYTDDSIFRYRPGHVLLIYMYAWDVFDGMRLNYRVIHLHCVDYDARFFAHWYVLAIFAAYSSPSYVLLFFIFILVFIFEKKKLISWQYRGPFFKKTLPLVLSETD